MKKILNIEYYSDGIDETQFTCTEIPIAASCGYYYKDYYYYYLFMRTFYANWKKKDENNYKWKNLFKALGLSYEAVDVKDEKELITTIINLIENQTPVLVPVSYYDLPFSERYRDNKNINKGMHYILVNGYDSEKHILYTRMSPHVYSDAVLNNNTGLYTYRMKETMLQEIWNDSNNGYFKSEPRWRNKVFNITSLSPDKEILFDDIITGLTAQCNYEEDILKEKLKKLSVGQTKCLNDEMYFLRLDHEKYIEAFFYLFKKLVEENCMCTEFIMQIEQLQNEYTEVRKNLISKAHISILRNEEFDIEANYTNMIQLNKKLFGIIETVAKQVDKNRYNDTDYAVLSKIEVSSEDEEFFSPYNMVQANDEIWRSANIYGTHWIMFSFLGEIIIRNIRIVHDSNYNKTTNAYEILISADKENWEKLCEVNDNHKFFTEHKLFTKKCRYLKINILKPALISMQARIKRVRIYGVLTES